MAKTNYVVSFESPIDVQVEPLHIAADNPEAAAKQFIEWIIDDGYGGDELGGLLDYHIAVIPESSITWFSGETKTVVLTKIKRAGSQWA